MLLNTQNYSYVKNKNLSAMRANIIGYQSNVDYISSEYRIYYES